MDNNTIIVVDFESINSMSYSVPVSFRFYRKQERNVASWKELYILVMKELARQKPECFLPGEGSCIVPEKEIGDVNKSKSMRNPMILRRGVYIETNLGSETILRRIRDALTACEILYRHLIISYYIDEDRKKEQEERRLQAGQKPKVYVLNWNLIVSYNGAIPISYRYKTRRACPVESWPLLYVRLMTDLHSEYPKKIKNGIAARGRRSPDIVNASKRNDFRRPQSIGDNLLLETFGTIDALLERMYSFLELCNVNPDDVTIRFKFDDSQRESEYLNVIKGKQKEILSENVDRLLLRRCKKLLKKYFPKGYRTDSWIDMNRLRSRYQSDYSEELEISDEELMNLLFSIGLPLNGLIYAQKNDEQDAVVEEILRLIYDTFEGGATCIYLESLYNRYQQQLSEQFNIFSGKALAELIGARLDRTYAIKRAYIYYGRRIPAPETEIISEMKRQTTPVSVAEIHSSLWYFPEEKIDQILTGLDEIVLVETGIYYYAPSLPISRTDLGNIKQDLRQMLIYSKKLTEMEVLNVVVQECPAVLGEASFLNWMGFWRSLCYLLRDVINADNCEKYHR